MEATLLSMEILDSRRMLSVSLSGGTLTVVGKPAAANVITVKLSADSKKYEVDLNGSASSFDVTGIKTITLRGGSKNDILTIDPKITLHEYLYGYDGNDTLTGGSTADAKAVVAGSISGVRGSTHVDAGLGDDTVIVYGGRNFVAGGAGKDSITGSNGRDQIDGGIGDDSILAGAGNDIVHGGDGNDFIDLGDGNDLCLAGKGNDHVLGGKGNDRIFGLAGNDTIEGGDGNDQIHGVLGSDLLKGDAGNDTLFAGGSADTLIGGTGKDVFIIREPKDIDTIITQADAESI